MTRARPLVLIALASAVLSACASAPAGPVPLTPLSRWSLQVEEGVDRIALAVHETGLSPNQRAALSVLADRFAHAGADMIVVQTPAGNDPVAAEVAWGARAALQQTGVPAERIRVESYYAPDPRAPVLAGFSIVQAHVPRCGAASDNLARVGSGQTPTNFGCALNANLAAQIADPRDIAAPRAMTPGDSGRRTVVFENYRAGEPTSAPQEELVRSRVSQAVD